MSQGKFLIITILLLQFVSAHSNEVDKIFTVEGIKTYYDSGDLENSKIFANNKATIEGFKKLVFKLILASYQSKVYKIRNIDILGAVKTITPTKERMTSHSYMATVTIHFDPQKIKDILNNYGIRYKTQFSNKILFIPIFYEDETFLNRDWKYKVVEFR